MKMGCLLWHQTLGANAERDTSGGVTIATIHTQTASAIVDWRDPIAFLQWLTSSIGCDTFAKFINTPDHFVTGHHSAFAKLSAPHVHFRTTDIGPCDLRENRPRSNLGQLKFVEL
jgi:hypothetical protein